MKDVKFMSAKEKWAVLKAWELFVDSGFERSKFTKALYQHLTLHCSFIAHYNQEGFYETYFVRPADTIRFISQFADGRSIEYGDMHWLNSPDCSDINQAMCSHMQEAEQELNLRQQYLETQKAEDLAVARKILQKYDIAIPEELAA
jgi:hypothetical protein